VNAPLVLNVDDTDASRYVKTRILRHAGFDVVEATTGMQALEMLHTHAPALVLLDVKLPDVSGREVCARIKADPATANVVVLQTSASFIDSSARVASLDAGADGYLVEPMEAEELVANVRALLRMRQAEDERQAALNALREADRRKDEFLAMLAHELRNPLAPIRNAVEVMRRSNDPQVQVRARELIGRQTDHLTRLVDDLLDMSRIASGKITLQKSVASLASILEGAVDLVRPMLERNSQQLVANLPAEDVWVTVDPVRVSQVVGNLLHNAAKFTEAGGRIALEAQVSRDGVQIAVTDNGMGIAADVLPHVFELFSQADRSLDRTQGGLGIGLSLVRGLVELHGGVVDAYSAGVGQGSRFVVRLPAMVLASGPPQPRAQPPAAGAKGPRRILVVEDNADAAESMLMLLQGLGHQVSMVNDGAQAVAAAKSFRPDVILLDIGLPGVDGYELVRQLRLVQETRDARMVAVTGYGQPRDRERSAAAGFDHHLVKPVDPAKLAEAVAD
jgi:signal transduction histidine kinase